MPVSNFLAGRAQMGTSLGFHIIFASLGVGLPVAIAIAHFIALRRDDAGWLRLAARLTRALAVLVVVGVISGIVISIELVLIWPQFMAKAGPVIGLPFSLETYAFFVEAIFLSLYLFARDRLRPWVHWATMLPVCLGGLASAWIVVAANAWMNTPAGFRYVHGRFTHPDPYRAIFNPSMPAETFHMAASAYLATGLAIAAVYATAMLRGRSTGHERRGLALGMAIAAASIVPLGLAGDLAGRTIAQDQPVKLAAAEALPHTTTHAPFTILGLAGQDGHTRFGIHIPDALSLLVGRSASARVVGLGSVPPNLRPPVAIVHTAFDLMILIGALLGVAIGAYWASRWRRPRWLSNRPLLILYAVCGPLAFVAIEAGWTVTEVGRQPWIVYGLVHTRATLTNSGLVGLMFALFSVLYLILSGVTIVAVRSQLRLRPGRARAASLPAASR
jgi:cytochrome d ubiquinol oxidase subunit I